MHLGRVTFIQEKDEFRYLMSAKQKGIVPKRDAGLHRAPEVLGQLHAVKNEVEDIIGRDVPLC